MILQISHLSETCSTQSWVVLSFSHDLGACIVKYCQVWFWASKSSVWSLLALNPPLSTSQRARSHLHSLMLSCVRSMSHNRQKTAPSFLVVKWCATFWFCFDWFRAKLETFSNHRAIPPHDFVSTIKLQFNIWAIIEFKQAGSLERLSLM